MYTVVLVEDEKDLCNLIKIYLERENYQVICFDEGSKAIQYIGKKADLWILDIMLKDDVSGYDVIKKIRENDENVPVIFTSARDQELDKILGLELGSDDYLTKPFSTKELILRVNNIIKRVYKKSNIKKIEYEEYLIDLEKRIVTSKKKEIKLTTLEFDLLILFLQNKTKCFTREEILNSIWGSDYFGTDRVVDDAIRRLRKKMPKLNLKAVYGYGYRLSWFLRKVSYLDNYFG